MIYICPKCGAPPSSNAAQRFSPELPATLDCRQCGYSPGREAERNWREQWEERERGKKAENIIKEKAADPHQYLVLEGDRSELEQKVNKAIREGWEPIGAVSSVRVPYSDGSGYHTMFSQAMRKR